MLVAPMLEDVAAAKAELRARIRHRRKALRHASSEADWVARGHGITAAVVAMDAVRRAAEAGSSVAIYESRRTEPPTKQLIESLLDLGVEVSVPVIMSPETMNWISAPSTHSGGTPAPNRACDGRTLEALNCSVVIVPALAVGRDHSRLGQGGGYFDRLIAKARRPLPRPVIEPAPAPVFIALVGPGEVLDTVPHDLLDQPVDDWCVG